MEKKQTAVEWYENRLIELDIDFGGHKNYWIERKKIREQAKQMEKEQMIDAILDNRNITSQVTLRDAEQYYNETYGGQDEN
jgi:hypothetical protein